ncbi:MAG TPA: Ig-like domain-containing protein [Candidatus Dojkabacteria bacterium]|nr:Ig-like domain-containing protein [Candidatus Dojkabacteria bacterium]
MNRTHAPIKRKQKSILLTFLLILTLPIFIFTLLENRSFDFRNKAFEEIELSNLNPCIITFPNVNPYTIQVNSTVRIQVDGISENSTIKELTITDGSSNILFTKSYEDKIVNRVSESFPYTPLVARAYNLSGNMKDIAGNTFSCVISSPYDIKGVKAISLNSKPEFLTSPRDSIPSQSIQVGDTYEYTLEAKDVDQDTINYIYSFTKGEEWLESTIIDDGADGMLTIKFRGSTKKAGSYLANVFIHDGYSKHLSSQSWVISVSNKENDNPTVTIIDPSSSIVINEQGTVPLKWEVEDKNQIIRYEIYISQNPVNETTWEPIDTNVPGTQTNYTVDLNNKEDGAYRLIVRAIDDQEPAGVGVDISEEILISRNTESPEKPDDNVELPEPQIINMSPTSKDEVKNNIPTIKASLIASEGAVVQDSSIIFKLDDRDVTDEIKINEVEENQHTVIYIPPSGLTNGVHKVSIYFEDSNGGEREVEWTFSIGDESASSDSDVFNILGLEIPKRTLYIVFGGIALIALAVIVPLLLPLIWKDTSKEVSKNTILPDSIPPTTEIPVIPISSPANKLTQEKFLAPEPDVTNIEPENEVIATTSPVAIDEKEVEEPKEEITVVDTSGQTTVEGITPMFEDSQPEPDLENLYDQLKELEEKEENKQKDTTS